MNYRFFISAIVAGMALAVCAEERNIPQNYYLRMDGKASSQLKTAVCTIIYPHTKLSYSSLWDYYKSTDVLPGGTVWWDMYSDEVRYVSAGSTGMNKEHSFPKSWWGGSTTIYAYTDLNHLYPSDEKANSAKSNWPLGEVDRTKKVQFSNGVSTTGTPKSGQGGGATTVFEPDDRYKGDLARAYFYMATCYQDLAWDKTYMVNSETYPTLNAWSREMLLRWSREDPVSQKEIDRNEAVYRQQGNRNPFIDFPDLAEYIWGTKVGEQFILSEHLGNTDPNPYPGEPKGEPTLLTPVQDFVLEFGEVALGKQGSAILLLRGQDLDESKSLRLAVYDNSETDDAALFTIDGGYSQTVSTVAANAPDGLNVRIDYSPVSVGEHESRLVISRGGLVGSIGIKLHGYCLPTPSLSAPVALPPSDVSSNSYTANWQPADEEIDYYILNRTKYEGGKAQTEQIEVVGDTRYQVTDFCGSESYTVQSVRLEVVSQESNSVSVTPSAIVGVDCPPMFGTSPYPGGILITTPERIDQLKVYDFSGKIIAVYYNVNNNDVITLPSGVYILSDGYFHIKSQVL